MKNFFKLFVPAVAALALVSCQKEQSNPDAPKTGKAIQVRVHSGVEAFANDAAAPAATKTYIDANKAIL